VKAVLPVETNIVIFKLVPGEKQEPPFVYLNPA
jgi:hypothetical protein